MLLNFKNDKHKEQSVTKIYLPFLADSKYFQQLWRLV